MGGAFIEQDIMETLKGSVVHGEISLQNNNNRENPF